MAKLTADPENNISGGRRSRKNDVEHVFESVARAVIDVSGDYDR
ncbi:putative bacteriocin precursor peptide PlnK [Lactiplantibacillus plantarum]|nr:putative bacteriocin precursor peptide PlnK [Lactiplantibacillus plantarum]